METYEFDDPEKFREFLETPRKRNKYNAKKVTADGYTFDSQSEYRRYLYLKSEFEAGRIDDLEVHPRYLIVDGYFDRQIGKWIKEKFYVADFSYRTANLAYVVEDVKGGKATQTALFKLKWALMHQLYDYTLRIIES